MTRHTRGPWQIVEPRASFPSVASIAASHDLERTLADIVGIRANDLANARLMAAAPRLLAVLHNVAEDCGMALSGEWDKGDEGFQATLDLVEEAIREAVKG